jgi:hypothetical protein
MGRSYLSFLGSQRSPQFSIFSFYFFWQNAHLTLKPLYLDKKRLFEKSKSIFIDYFFDSVLLLTRNQVPFYRLGIQFRHFIQFPRPSEGVFARCLAR